MPDDGERPGHRDGGIPRFRERLQQQEIAERKKAHEDGRERPPKPAEQLDRIATETARRFDRRHD